MKLLLLLLLLLLLSCSKEPEITPNDCHCGIFTDKWEQGDKYYLEWEDRCSGSLDTIWWFKVMSGCPEIGDSICELLPVDPDEL